MPPLPKRKLPLETLTMVLIATLCIIGGAQAVAAFTPTGTFAISLLPFNKPVATRDLSNVAPTPNSTSTLSLGSEKVPLSDELYTVLLVVCFSAVLVSVSLMILVIELRSGRRKKLTL